MDFLTVVALKFHKHSNDAKNYLKKFSIGTFEIADNDTGDFSSIQTQSTNPLLIKALTEVQNCYPLRPKEKFSLVVSLIFNVILMSGWIFYLWALATDIELLYRSYGCVSIHLFFDFNNNNLKGNNFHLNKDRFHRH